ncbi:hypothetical protein KVT40_008022 [Elsinoe batatas]|uniref:YDG domain-containing protein n=1 Tax=Elsinoe batatas TaxID=2601811 RepID=A0A8K0KW22_9PEZI|nr:hypothetical protein KVT40_008022 [Elsinoe batatas]
MAFPVLLRKQFRLDELFDDNSESSGDDSIDPDFLRSQARWIRDDLDPKISQEGPEWLKPDQVVTVFRFLEQLRRSRVPERHIRSSRIHLAVALIAGQATRWPGSVVDVADKLLENWSIRYGEISEIGIDLYDEGGRLHGICLPTDLTKEVLEVKWSKASGSKTNPPFSRRHGDLGSFKPGDWWINTMLAYHASIIDSGNPLGRIIADKHGAYAIILNERDELDSPRPEIFTYKAKSTEPGRFRLTAATPASRQPIRVLRAHSLRSFWAPKAGLRYDGLYKVSGWSIKQDQQSKAWNYDIRFERCLTELPMSEVLRHPVAEEVDDYTEYKRIRHVTRLTHNTFHRAKPLREPVRMVQPLQDTSSTAGGEGKMMTTGVSGPNAPAFNLNERLAVPAFRPKQAARSRLRIELPTPPILSDTSTAINPEAPFGEALTIPSPTKAPRTPIREILKTVLPLPGLGVAKKVSPLRAEKTPVQQDTHGEDYFSLPTPPENQQ